jgi:hypothetical protein
MRRTLTVLVATAALLAPAAAASASPPEGRGPGFNASCSNGHGGNDKGEYNGLGNSGKASTGGCVKVAAPRAHGGEVDARPGGPLG